jgi:DNA-binding PadR family transcriptional regulator
MEARTVLTKLEDQILMTVWKFNKEAYGVNIYQHLHAVTESNIALGVIYANLDRLERKGYLKSYLGEPTAVRGGMRKKYFMITKIGKTELAKSKQILDKIWQDFSALSLSEGQTR